MTEEQWNFLYSVYGSHLYGTATDASDLDEKVIYIPSLDSLLLCQKPKTYKDRVDADGNKVADNTTMPANGQECEYIPIQTFVRDFVKGQTYALEIAHAYLAKGPPQHGPLYMSEYADYKFLRDLVEKFGNCDVYSMVSFAIKQTLDYVHRGERLKAARDLLKILSRYATLCTEVRLDTVIDTEMVLDTVAREAGLKTGVSENNNKVMRTLELNGRSYLQTTTIMHIRGLVIKLIDSYGDRTNAAAEKDVDFKSLSHAIRVYEQSIELLDTGKIVFPRPNVEYLLSVKHGKEELESVKERLKQLDQEVQTKIETSTIRKRTPELEAAADQWLLGQLHGLYGLSRYDE